MTFNSKLWAARVNPSFEVSSSEDALQAYLSQFAHKGCGGAPQKGHFTITCSVCKQSWKWLEKPLGEILKKLPFKNMVLR